MREILCLAEELSASPGGSPLHGVRPSVFRTVTANRSRTARKLQKLKHSESLNRFNEYQRLKTGFGKQTDGLNNRSVGIKDPSYLQKLREPESPRVISLYTTVTNASILGNNNPDPRQLYARIHIVLYKG
jgi:hypothetical protein